MRHLYDKLGAHRRLEALDRARALGLLAPVPQRALTFMPHFFNRKLRIEAYVLHADDLLAFMLGDGVPDGHVVRGQVQLVGTGQWVVAGESIREGRDRLV